MALGVRLGVWCASAVASLSPAVCLATGTSHNFVVPGVASAVESPGNDDSVTVAWVARERAIRGYTVRVACAADRIACPDREWFVARQGGTELSSYVVRVRVPAGATVVRVGLEAVDQNGRHVPMAERVVPQAPERLRGSRPVTEEPAATIGACTASGSLDSPRPFLLALLQQRERAVPAGSAAPATPVPILLSSRGPPAAS